MPFIQNTPESLLARSDSKNPASTCRGLTSNGRPCRRALSQSPQRSLNEAFCWQHQEQVPQILAAVKERNSIDTLAERLGLLEIKKRNSEKPRRTELKEKPRRHKKPPPKQSGLALLCCMGTADNTPPPRPIKSHPPQPRPTKPARPSLPRDPSSNTGRLLSLIPPTTSPQTTALLLAELAKPFSEQDDEGYIYMFWLTPESMPDAPSETAPSLLAPPTRPTPGHRRTSDVLNTFASTTSSARSPNKKTILLKIGRAQNVQRRLNQWTRQCGHNLSLIRYYPYHNTSSTSIPKSPRKVPYVNRAERLIHLELAGKRVQGTGQCEACGREHREWFEVDASREGVKVVDEVIRRWVDWVERQASR